MLVDTMKGLIFATFIFASMTLCNGSMPYELSRILGLSANQQKENSKISETVSTDFDEQLTTTPDGSTPGVFRGRSRQDDESRKASIEDARKRLNLGDVSIYTPPPIQQVECHVEFQVTERVPGRCTRLAGSIPACQAEQYVGINFSECN